MPVYTYHCDNCDHEFDKKQSFSDNPLKTCPECKKKMLHKVYKPANVVFKGSGYYVTDNKSSKKKTSTGAESKDSKNGKGETKSESKSESKSETKTEKKEKKETKTKT